MKLTYDMKSAVIPIYLITPIFSFLPAEVARVQQCVRFKSVEARQRVPRLNSTEVCQGRFANISNVRYFRVNTLYRLYCRGALNNPTSYSD